MVDEITFNAWCNPKGGSRRMISDVPATMIVTHTLFQCFQLRRLAQATAGSKPELQWMLKELDPGVVLRIIVAAMIYQERGS